MKLLFQTGFWISLWIVPFGRVSAQPPEAGRPSPWSAGVFMNVDSRPYEGADTDIRVFPSIVYRSEKVQWLGPYARAHLTGNEKWSLAAHGSIQFPPYEEQDVPILQGMGDRSTTLLLGLDLEVPLPCRTTFRAALDGEVLGAYDGTQLSAAFVHSLGRPFMPLSGTLGAGVLFQDQNWTRYTVGVPAEKATENRPAYAPEESFHPFLVGTLLINFGRHWSLLTLARVEFLDETWRDSPLIGEDQRLSGFVTVNYTF